MNLDTVITQVATQLDTITGLQIYDFPPDQAYPPCAIVAWPDSYDFDLTYGRGGDRMSLPVVVLVGKVSDRAARTNLAAYCDGSGASSIKAVLESASAAYTAFHTVRVESVTFDVISMAGIDYMAALFTLDITGSGA
jgi:hypothetical protein